MEALIAADFPVRRAIDLVNFNHQRTYAGCTTQCFRRDMAGVIVDISLDGNFVRMKVNGYRAMHVPLAAVTAVTFSDEVL